MAAFKKGDTVKLVAVIPQGPVIAMRMDDDGNVQYLVEWVVDTTTHTRWFNEAELTLA
jgi:hypothetical protein